MPRATATHVEDLVRQLYSLGRVRRAIDRHALTELGGQGFRALGAVHLKSTARVSDVASYLSVDLSVASRQVAALKEAGYVAQERDPADGRAQVLTVTERGSEVLAESHRRMVEGFGEVVAGWSAADVVRLTELLAQLRTDFDALQEPA